MTTILALDSSSENCSVAILHQQDLYQLVEHAPRKHTQRILPLTKQVLLDAQLEMADLDAVAFGCGPGSFTGIRIAAGVAQGLAYGLSKPIYAISNLQALALQSFLEHGVAHVLVCIDARMDEVYWAVFEVKKQQLEGRIIYTVNEHVQEQVSSPQEVSLASIDPVKLNETLVVVGIGSGLSLIPQDIQEQLSHADSQAEPKAESVAYLAQEAICRGESGDLENALPTYIRDTVTWNKLPGRE